MTAPADEAPIDPWDRQPSEPSRAHGIFCIYRDLGARRSLRAACQQFYGGDYTHYKMRNAQEWSRNWDWVARVAAWDAYLDRENRVAQVEAVREMNRRYANTAKAMLAKALLGLKQISPDEMDASDVARLAELASKIERLCLGEVTEHVKQDVKSEATGFVTLEVVERIVPVRGDGPMIAAAAPATPLALSAVTEDPSPVPPVLVPAPAVLHPANTSSAPANDEVFDLPDLPPPGI